MNDNRTTIRELKKLVDTFRQERDWGKHHTPKNLAVSIAIEAAELLEHFQWEEKKQNKKELEKELADIIIYCLFFAVSNKIDLAKAVETKMEYNSKKYPAKVFKNKKDHLKDYWQIKKKHRNEK